jgi:porin
MKASFLSMTAALALAAGVAGQAAAEDQASAGLWERDTLTGDWNGARNKLVDSGITLGLRYIGEVFGDVSGGLRRGAAYEDQFFLSADSDFEKMAGIDGLTGHFGGYSLQGRGPSVNLVGNALDVSNVEYLGRNQRTTRLFTLWLQQTMAEGAVSLRAGQLAVDDEFLVSPTAANMVNATFLWSPLGTSNLPAGTPNSQSLTNGAGYPLGAPGVRLQVSPTESISWLTGVFSHQPASVDRPGPQFKIHDAFIISELQWLKNQAKDAAGLPTMIKLGGWYDSGVFNDLSHDASGRPLLPGATPRRQRGETAIYGIVDQTLWRTPDSGDQAVSVFARAGFAPDDDINVVTWYADGGVALKGPLPGRTSDTLAIGIAYAGISGGARAADRLAGSPVRDYEILLEANYAAALVPWWTVQPTIQYVIHPGFGAQNPLPTAAPGMTIPDATVLGVRTTITF